MFYWPDYVFTTRLIFRNFVVIFLYSPINESKFREQNINKAIKIKMYYYYLKIGKNMLDQAQLTLSANLPLNWNTIIHN